MAINIRMEGLDVALFTEVPGCYAVTCFNHIERQVQVYARGLSLYVKHGGGYVRVYSNAGGSSGYRTAHPKLQVVGFCLDDNYELGTDGRGRVVFTKDGNGNNLLVDDTDPNNALVLGCNDTPQPVNLLAGGRKDGQ